jgi:DNA adenine methylase
MTEKLKTFIKWPGNKTKHLRHLLPYIPDEYNTYIEPFIGSGALFLKLQPDKWIINDLNTDLIDCWKYVKDEPEIIIENFKIFGKIFKPMSNELRKEFCKELTNDLNHMKRGIIRTCIYMLMKYSAYMGTIFKDNKFLFYGLEPHIYIENRMFFLENNSLNNLVNVSNFLNTNGNIYNKDYNYILTKAKKGDFVFLDPPYIEEHDYGFSYNQKQVDNKFLQELHKEVKKLDKKGVMWMMTQADTKKVKEQFKKYHIKKFKVYRTGKKSYINELIIMNYLEVV